MPPKPLNQNSFIRGLVAVTNVLRQPKGSVQRASNLLLTRRDSLATCDGTLVLHAWEGQVQSTRGPILGALLFQPAGITPYYLILARCPDQLLGKPLGIAAALAAGGTLTVGTTYYYVVTALDGIGGETIASAEVSAVPTTGHQTITLTWQGIPNAAFYNIYRGTTSGGEQLLVGTGLPLPQPAYPPGTVTFTDTGAAGPGTANAITSISASVVMVIGTGLYVATVTVKVTNPLSVVPGQSVVISGVTPTTFNGTYTVGTVLTTTEFTYSSSLFTCPTFKGHPQQNCTVGGTGGSVGPPPTPPASDTTQQVCLFKCPAIQGPLPTLPVAYDNTMIVARYPADTSVIPVVGAFVTGGGQGGGGGSGGGGGIPPKGPQPLSL